jgi:hypothetical protein
VVLVPAWEAFLKSLAKTTRKSRGPPATALPLKDPRPLYADNPRVMISIDDCIGIYSLPLVNTDFKRSEQQQDDLGSRTDF